MEGKPRNNNSRFKNRIALVSAPWPLFNRPSIQLGTLKAYLKERFADLDVHAFHFFLEASEKIGFPIYQNISERSWMAESVYGALLFPERFDIIKALFEKESGKNKAIKKLSFEKLLQDTQAVTDSFLSRVEWEDYGLVGFSMCLCQLTSSLYMMKKIKMIAPQVTLVAGGSILGKNAARGLLNYFPQMDLAIVGEGEIPLTSLIEALGNTGELEKIAPITGVISRHHDYSGCDFNQVADLARLPCPDFDDYFDQLYRLAPQSRFFPVLPAEISRGCWHRKSSRSMKVKGCAFCNLNLQWKGYRTKGANQVASEIERLTSRYKSLSISFMDNVLPPKQISGICSALEKSGKDLKLFCELRASITFEDLEALRIAGLDEVQVGIESLSSRLLKKMNKGTTAIENLEIMKHCESLGIADFSNLLLRFPSSDEADVSETLKNMEFAEIYRPLKTVNFWLGLDSPVYWNHKHYGLTAVFNHPNYKKLFPSDIVKKVKFMIQDYRGDKARQGSLWKPVEKAVALWRENYALLHEKPISEPILSYRDGGDFMIMRRRKMDREPETHRLTGLSRKICLFCERVRSIEEISEKFPTVGENKINGFVNMMVQKKLMFREEQNVLSLAIPARSQCHFRPGKKTGGEAREKYRDSDRELPTGMGLLRFIS